MRKREKKEKIKEPAATNKEIFYFFHLGGRSSCCRNAPHTRQDCSLLNRGSGGTVYFVEAFFGKRNIEISSPLSVLILDSTVFTGNDDVRGRSAVCDFFTLLRFVQPKRKRFVFYIVFPQDRPIRVKEGERSGEGEPKGAPL